ncbi:hypothetical protein ACRS6B_28855 [Nocardia asteroides]
MLTDTVQLTDHHCHGVHTTALDRPGFERLLGEGARGSFDSAIGLAVRRWCAPALDLPAQVGADVYLRHRAGLGAREVAERLLRATGVNRWFMIPASAAAPRISPPWWTVRCVRWCAWRRWPSG